MVFRDLLKLLIRNKTPVCLNDLNRTTPISNVFGLDRGLPIDRYYIEKFLTHNKNYIHGTVLEIADNHYSKMYGNNVERYEVLHATPGNSNATIIGSLTDPETLPTAIIDCFICTQTFNFIFDVEKAILGAYHLLKPGGVLLSTVAGVCQISRYDMDRWGDYWRFTTASMERLFGKVFGDSVEVKSYGNVLAACALLQGVAVEDIPNMALLDENDSDYQVVITVVAQKAL